MENQLKVGVVGCGEATQALHVPSINSLASLFRLEACSDTSEEVMNEVWGTEYYGTQRSLDSFVASLRSKIEKKASKPNHILTGHGVGYKFVK